MVREDKHFEVTIDTLIEYTKSIKNALEYFIRRLEHEGHNMSWPQVLDSFSNNKVTIDSKVILPLMLTQEIDPELAKLTENRVQLVNHEMVPDYLRTKPDLEIEENEKTLIMKSDTISPEQAVKQVKSFEKIVDNVKEAIDKFYIRSESDWSKTAAKVACNQSETVDLIATISNGKNLKNLPGPHGRQMPITDSLLSPKPSDSKSNVKAPELKTSIKTGP